MLRSVKICSLHDLPSLNPACSSLSFLSISGLRRFSSTLQNTFPGTDSRVIPRQLLQSLSDPFLGNLIMTPCLQSCGTSSSRHIMLNRWVSSSATVSPPCLSISADISSNPAALLFFSARVAILTSCMLISSIEMQSSLCGSSASKLYVVSGAGWFSTSLKCSIHRSVCSSSVNRFSPVLLLMGIALPLHVLLSSRAILYRVLLSPLSAAFCASSPFSSCQCFLSFLQLFFTLRSMCLYSSSFVFHISISSSLSRSIFISFLLSIISHVVSLIHLSFVPPLLLPITSSALFVTACVNISHCSSLSVLRCSASNLFLTSSWNLCAVAASLSLSVANGLIVPLTFDLLNLNLIFPMIRLWSDPMSAPLYARTSCSAERHLPLMQM